MKNRFILAVETLCGEHFEVSAQRIGTFDNKDVEEMLKNLEDQMARFLDQIKGSG